MSGVACSGEFFFGAAVNFAALVCALQVVRAGSIGVCHSAYVPVLVW